MKYFSDHSRTLLYTVTLKCTDHSQGRVVSWAWLESLYACDTRSPRKRSCYHWLLTCLHTGNAEIWRVSFIWDQLCPCYLEHNLQLVSLSHDGHLQCSWSPLLQGRHQVCHPPDTRIINLSCLRELVNKPWHGVVSLHESSFINVYLSRCWNTKHVLNKQNEYSSNYIIIYWLFLSADRATL